MIEGTVLRDTIRFVPKQMTTHLEISQFFRSNAILLPCKVVSIYTVCFVSSSANSKVRMNSNSNTTSILLITGAISSFHSIGSTLAPKWLPCFASDVALLALWPNHTAPVSFVAVASSIPIPPKSIAVFLSSWIFFFVAVVDDKEENNSKKHHYFFVALCSPNKTIEYLFYNIKNTS